MMKHPWLTFSAVLIFTPLMLSGIASAQSPPHSPTLHFSADYFSKPVAQGGLGLASGTNVATAGHNWVDNISGAQATPFGIELTLFTDVINGNPVIRDDGTQFPGNNQWWLSDTEMLDKAPNLLSGTNDYTIMAVMQGFDPIPDPVNVGVVATWGNDPNSQNQWYLSAEPEFPVGPGGFQRTFQNTVPCCDSSFTSLSNFGLTSASITDDFHFWGWVKSGGTSPVLTLHTDGISSSIGGGVVNANLGTHGNLGGFGRRMNFQHGAGGFRGDLAEIIFYDYPLDSTQLADLDGYLTAKYIDPPPTENADFDNNNLVNGNDHLIFQRGFGTDAGTGNVAPQSDGNANGDQFINGADQVIWGNQYGGPPPISAVTSVPEPTSLSLALLACWALVGRDLRLKFKL